MTSLRKAFACIGLEGNVFVCSQLFGFSRKKVPLDPTGAIAKVSIRGQIQSLRNLQFHLNVIAVGSDLFSDNNSMQIDYSIYRLRQIYAQAGVSVGRVQHYYVPVAEALGHQFIGNEEAMKFMTHRWKFPNDGIHVFVPFMMSVVSDGAAVLGNSPDPPGPCEGESRDDDELNASVVGLFLLGGDQTARTFAHEIGHYLGLDHENQDPNNLMCQSGQAASLRNSIQLAEGQGETIRQHCLIRSGCLVLPEV